MSYKKILVAIERSPQADGVFEQALDLAKKNAANLMLFHCLPGKSRKVGSYTDLYGQELNNFSQDLQERLEKDNQKACNWLSNYYQKAIEEGVAAEWDCQVGKPGVWIRNFALSWGADLVVLGRRGRRGLAAMMLGSVSNYVMHNAPCSVLIVQGLQLTGAQTSEAMIQTSV